MINFFIIQMSLMTTIEVLKFNFTCKGSFYASYQLIASEIASLTFLALFIQTFRAMHFA